MVFLDLSQTSPKARSAVCTCLVIDRGKQSLMSSREHAVSSFHLRFQRIPLWWLTRRSRLAHLSCAVTSEAQGNSSESRKRGRFCPFKISRHGSEQLTPSWTDVFGRSHVGLRTSGATASESQRVLTG